jgi:hypothetical protein
LFRIFKSNQLLSLFSTAIGFFLVLATLVNSTQTEASLWNI